MQTREPTRTYPTGANRSRQSPSSIGITYRLHGSNNEQQDAQNQSSSYAEMDRVIGKKHPQLSQKLAFPVAWGRIAGESLTGVALALGESGPELVRRLVGGECYPDGARRPAEGDGDGGVLQKWPPADLVNPAAVIPRVGSRCEPATGKGRRPYARAHSQALFARSAGTTSSAAARGGRLELQRQSSAARFVWRRRGADDDRGADPSRSSCENHT